MKTIEPGIYEHYKGKRYEVIGVARHSETLEEFVVYQALYTTEEYGEGAIWVRPLDMFVETVTVNGSMIPRFKKIEAAG